MQLAQSAQDYVDDMERLPGGTAIPTSAAATPTGVTPSSTPILSALAKLIPAGLTAYQQLQLQNLQMNLIKQGRPPLTAQQIAAMAPQLNIGVAQDTQRLLMYGGGALLALVLISQLGKRRRA
jgi:hypothetical protein